MNYCDIFLSLKIYDAPEFIYFSYLGYCIDDSELGFGVAALN